eukprot:CAMPEP_0202472832 /NCGR_PEP_ID=MMETSP1360-20130828/89030_1 /ASSEMBLY_ACC=CAM_ASM_000848 /TAXON_ID=515479 /ORGANISM="Licmophora paradoxa, Strain CCMP2313" /LENGTH=55 /DNA_ID=CAMNT_0049099499 /DNA_START=37 /DNA_END=205 /DNA_ORIENTATION=-
MVTPKFLMSVYQSNEILASSGGYEINVLIDEDEQSEEGESVRLEGPPDLCLPASP